jgi:hypothetical protein
MDRTRGGKVYHPAMSHRFTRVLFAAAALGLASAPARADNYPVNGYWTYEHASEKGPTKDCGQHNMQFAGRMRYDTDGGVHEYKNLSAPQIGASTYNIVDEFFTGMIRGNSRYTLRIVDADHIELHFEKGGRTTLLRRCE